MSKKKNPKKILFIFLAIEMIITSFNVFFVVKNKQKDVKTIPEISNVAQQSSIEAIEKKIKIDVTNKNIPNELNGNYYYSSIVEIVSENEAISSDKELTYTEINKISNNSIKDELHLLKHRHFNEYISFCNGKYIMQNNNVLAEEGFYYGNTDKTYIYIKNTNGTIEHEGTYYSISYTVSLSGYWLKTAQENDNTKLYVREKILCNGKYYYVTYEYKFK